MSKTKEVWDQGDLRSIFRGTQTKNGGDDTCSSPTRAMVKRIVAANVDPALKHGEFTL